MLSLLEAVFPGLNTFWVSPSGDVRPAPEGHLDFMVMNYKEMRIPEAIIKLVKHRYSAKGENDSYEAAFKSGWSRIGSSQRGSSKEHFYAGGNFNNSRIFSNLINAFLKLGVKKDAEVYATDSQTEKTSTGTFEELMSVKSFAQLSKDRYGRKEGILPSLYCLFEEL